jgi:peptidyl-prolyl cis-trans isomerase A (cyclophilin A)
MSRRLPHRAAGIVVALFAVHAHATEVAMCTDRGRVTIELFDEQAPEHVSNFLRYADAGFYAGTAFHRVVPGFVIQAGGFDRRLRQKPTGAPIANASGNGLTNARGTLAAARTSDPDSATSQFFINLSDNTALDGAARNEGYTVFGRVTEGMAIVDAIGSLPTGASGPFSADVPEPLVAVTSIMRLDRALLTELGDSPADAIRAQIQGLAPTDPAALEWLNRYRAVCGPIDPALLLLEARAAQAAAQPVRAGAALDEYFAMAESSEPGYEEAVALRLTLSPASAAAPDPSALSGCTAPPAVPAIPDAETAQMDEMIAGQEAVRTFLSGSETYLACLSAALKNDAWSEPERAVLVQAHNTTVGQMESVAEEFNEQVRIMRGRR